jgi:3-methyladenine DNA glycosylase AlkC
MADNLKNNYNKSYIERIAFEVSKQYSSFDKSKFIKLTLNSSWKNLELKDRMKRISSSLHSCLPTDYDKSMEIILISAHSFGGFEGMFFPDFVETYGFEKKNWKISLNSLEELTKFSSSEFAIRPFIISDPNRVMKLMLKWSKSKNYHVRRLASEGCRPRLPWAIAIPEFKKDPSLILPILENLKNDSELYVRRSVANNLNDISKDNPEVVLKIAKSWIGQNENIDWVVKHALRTLLKKGNQKALKLFGYGSLNSVNVSPINLEKKNVKIGGDLSFSFKINCKKSSKLRIEYVIDYMKKNGMHSSKVFKISEKEFEKGEHLISSKQSFREMTTRKHYCGVHFISVIINGIRKESYEFKVK